MKKVITLIFVFSLSISCFYAQEGYSGRLGLGWGSDYNLMLNTCHGVYLKPCLFLGMGTGVSTPVHRHRNQDGTQSDTYVFPVFLEAQYIPFKSKVAPFLSMQVGGENTWSMRYFPNGTEDPQNEYKLVGVASPALGVKLRLIDKTALYASFSAHFRTSATYSISQHAFSFSIGIEF
ncbi:MAG: hypothetical protein ACTTKO_10825 [Candidatus Limimorpha sp.]